MQPEWEQLLPAPQQCKWPWIGRASVVCGNPLGGRTVALSPKECFLFPFFWQEFSFQNTHNKRVTFYAQFWGMPILRHSQTAFKAVMQANPTFPVRHLLEKAVRRQSDGSSRPQRDESQALASRVGVRATLFGLSAWFNCVCGKGTIPEGTTHPNQAEKGPFSGLSAWFQGKPKGKYHKVPF